MVEMVEEPYRILAQHIPRRHGWGPELICLCRRQFRNGEEWAKHALREVHYEKWK